MQAAPEHALGPSWVARVKNRIVADGPRMRRLPSGIGRGLLLELDLQHWTKLYLGLYEIELNRYLRRFCLPGTKCFDIGGQHGYDALVLAKLGAGRIISFECDPTAYQAMLRSFANNASRIRAPEARLGFVGRHSDPRTGRLSLDDVTAEPDGFVPDFVKIDVEGAELEVLEGATSILAARRPHLIVETHSPQLEQACGGLLCAHGYRPKVVEPRRWLRDNRRGHNRWLVAEGRWDVGGAARAPGSSEPPRRSGEAGPVIPARHEPAAR